MKVRVLTRDDELAGFWSEWAHAWERASTATPFQSPAWLQAWWTAFGSGMPVVAVATVSRGTCGVFPLYRHAEKLLPMGVGITDYFDLLLTDDAPAGSASALLAAGLAAGGEARCDLPDLAPGAWLREIAAPAGWNEDSWPGPPCPVLPLRRSLAESIPRSMLRDLRQARHRADRAGGAQFVRATHANLTQWLDTLAALHAARWQERSEPGVLADPVVRRFHDLAAPALLEAGLLRLVAVLIGGQPAGVVHALRDRERLYLYLGGFDPARRYESPGTLLIGYLLEEAIEQGATEVHFLRGAESYKYRWGARDRDNRGRSFLPA